MSNNAIPLQKTPDAPCNGVQTKRSLQKSSPRHPFDAFEILGEKPRFALDMQGLETRALHLQCTHHPDRFVGDPDAQARAQEKFSAVVWAFEQLKDPKNRARLLFQGYGQWPAPHDTTVLMELLETEEQLVDGTRTAADIQGIIDSAVKELGPALDAHKWHKAGTLFMRINGLRRLLRQGRTP